MFLNILLFITVKLEKILIGSYEDMTHETHTILFTNSRKRAIGFTPGVFQGVYFKVFISFVHSFGIIVKEKCRPFNQGIIHQPIMSINKVIAPMTELSDPPSYKYLIVSLVFSHLGFWSGNLFLIAPFPDICLLVPYYNFYSRVNKLFGSFLKRFCN